MKNSVKDRMNAQSSAAGHFIESHLVGDKWDYTKWPKGLKKGIWVHCDIAGVASDDDNMGTGFGACLLAQIVEKF